jgi:periplasmic divalent cation tolerance protein
MTDKRIVLVTVPDLAVAEKIAETVVEEQLAACANIIPGLVSIYIWKGKRERSSELLMILKTREIKFADLRDRILSLHPYEVPAIVSFPIEDGSAAFLNWIDESVSLR